MCHLEGVLVSPNKLCLPSTFSHKTKFPHVLQIQRLIISLKPQPATTPPPETSKWKKPLFVTTNNPVGSSHPRAGVHSNVGVGANMFYGPPANSCLKLHHASAHMDVAEECHGMSTPQSLQATSTLDGPLQLRTTLMYSGISRVEPIVRLY